MRFAPVRFALLSFASLRYAPLRSGRMLRFSARHAFQPVLPCLSKVTCLVVRHRKHPRNDPPLVSCVPNTCSTRAASALGQPCPVHLALSLLSSHS